MKQNILHCLKAGVSPQYPEQGTPQGGVVSPLLANIALNGIEDIHNSVRYADDMIRILKPEDDEKEILEKIEDFLRVRGMNISQKKTKVTASTTGFDFLGWHFKVKVNGKFNCTPSEDNLKTFRKKVKKVINNSNYGAKVKSNKLASIVRGWRNYHKYCDMNNAKHSLYHIQYRAWKVFIKEKKLNRYQVDKLIKAAFPTVSFAQNRFINVTGEKSPYDRDITYWSKRNSRLYNNHTARALKKQSHSCRYCGLGFLGQQKVHLHPVISG
jgi:hypothetical protein